MKYLLFLIAILMTGTAAASPPVNWSLLWSGSWEESTTDSTSLITPALSGTLHNRGELKLHLPLLGLMLRSQVLSRHPLNFEFDPFAVWSDPEKMITHYMGGLYHRPTGSRLLYGVIDEWGLSARIRNPWIRSPPYTENHKPLMADLKTAASSTKEDELYLYLSSPYLELFPNFKLRGFVSTQTETDFDYLLSQTPSPTLSGGLDFLFAGKKGLLLEMFYTGKTLPLSRSGTWFSNPPRLPERDFHLYACGLLFTSPAFSISSDFAISETFAWGEDFYCNLGFTITPLLPIGNRARPLAISFAADGSGERFVNRDGANLSEGFRGAAKVELKGMYNSLIRFNTVLRGPGFGEELNRSSTGFYWRFPSVPANRNLDLFPVRLTRISLSADRNAVNPLKISDNFSGSIGFNVYLPDLSHNKPLVRNPLGLTFSGVIRGVTSSGEAVSFYPIPDESWSWDTTVINCDLFWSPGKQGSPSKLQFRSRVGVSIYPEKEEKWNFSLSTALRFNNGRFSFRIASPDFPEKWNWTVSWRLEKQEKR
jgi:hypothetical protein